jgi:hypothetical protein
MLLLWIKIAICLVAVIALLAESGSALSQKGRVTPGEIVFRLVITGLVFILITQVGTEGLLAQVILY